jgi:protease-4
MIAKSNRRPNPRHIRAALLPLVLLAGCAPTSLLITPVPADRALAETVLYREGAWTVDKIALIDVDGVIANARSQSLLGVGGENPVALFKEKLDRAARDPRVKAIVVRINSPGGTVTASDLMYLELCRFRAQTGRPAVASMLDVAASGGYYIACATDRIYAHPTTITGSIGVIMMTPDVSGTMQRIGMQMNVVKSGPRKDAGSMFRPMNEEDRAVFENLVERMYGRFLSIVGDARDQLPPDELRALADGRVFLGTEACELGLVDEVGTVYDAIAGAKRLAGLDGRKVVVVQYARPLAHRPNVYAKPPAGPAQVNLINVELPTWLRDPTPRMWYLWAPGW